MESAALVLMAAALLVPVVGGTVVVAGVAGDTATAEAGAEAAACCEELATSRLRMFLSVIWRRWVTGGIREIVAGRRLTSCFISLRRFSN